MPSQLADLSHAIQLAVAPVFLLTAIATLINAMNTRLGRIVDRRRVVTRWLLDQTPATEAEAARLELERLKQRGGLIYQAILFETLSALLVCLVVAGAFTGTMLRVELATSVALGFIAALLSMIIGLGLFLREVFLAVRAQTHWEP